MARSLVTQAERAAINLAHQGVRPELVSTTQIPGGTRWIYSWSDETTGGQYQVVVNDVVGSLTAACSCPLGQGGQECCHAAAAMMASTGALPRPAPPATVQALMARLTLDTMTADQRNRLIFGPPTSERRG